jgi:ribonuclease Z
MNFEVTILGSSSALPTLNRNPSSQYVKYSNLRILIDCGEGTQIQMRRLGIKIQNLDLILISHLHGDHYLGIFGLLSTMSLLGRDSELTIVCPIGLKNIIFEQLKYSNKFGFNINFIELKKSENRIIYEDKFIYIETFPLLHKIQTHGFIIREKEKERKFKKSAKDLPFMKLEYIHLLKKGENVTTDSGKLLLSELYTEKPNPSFSYAYCSDTIYDENIIKYIKNVTVLYHEATFTEKNLELAKTTMHSTAKQAAKIAKLASVAKLYLGHLSSRYSDVEEHEQEAKQIFENSEYVYDGMKFLVEI